MFWVFPSCGHCGWCCREHLCMHFCVEGYFNFFWIYIPRIGMAEPSGKLLEFTTFSKMTTPFNIPTNSAWGSPFHALVLKDVSNGYRILSSVFDFSTWKTWFHRLLGCIISDEWFAAICIFSSCSLRFLSLVCSYLILMGLGVRFLHVSYAWGLLSTILLSTVSSNLVGKYIIQNYIN